MYFQIKGLENGPVLVCVPGLMGGPEDFYKMMPSLEKSFTILIIDPNDKRRLEGGINLGLEAMKEISYDPISEDIKELLFKHFPDRRYYFLGLSIGGKVVFDFASKFPDLFSGGLVTDVGLGAFSDSDLFKTLDYIVENVDLNLTWPDLKKSLQDKIPDKNLRLFVQTQVSYPNKAPPAIWKAGIKNVATLLKRQSLENQEESFAKVDLDLARQGHLIHVMHAEHLSGISPRTFNIMKEMKSLKFYEISNATHFVQISHADLIINITLSMLEA